MIVRLDPPIPLDTPKGPGMAHFFTDYGVEHDNHWTVFINTGPHAREIWTFQNRDVRTQANATLNRGGPNADLPVLSK